MSEPEVSITYRVVVNHEEQYSLWPADKENALGWQDAGFNGTKADALAYINAHWTDMRPLSLRQAMERDQQPVAVAAVATPQAMPTPAVATPSEADAQAAKAKRGWFGRQHDDTPASTPETTDDGKQKRGWFGRR